jgi:hypothetical protein
MSAEELYTQVSLARDGSSYVVWIPQELATTGTPVRVHTGPMAGDWKVQAVFQTMDKSQVLAITKTQCGFEQVLEDHC